MAGVKKKGKGRSKPVFRLRFGRFLFDLVICFLALTLVPVLVYRLFTPTYNSSHVAPVDGKGPAR